MSNKIRPRKITNCEVTNFILYFISNMH